MKRVLLGLALLGALSAPALPQGVNQVAQPGTISAQFTKQTFSAGFIGLVPPASATDTICLAGSASKVIKLTRIELSGSAGTLVSLPITLVRRASANTGGTAASTTANPANNIAKNDTTNGTATAVPIAYTAVPTIGDTSPTYLRSAELTLPVTTAGVVSAPLVWTFGGQINQFAQSVVLRGAADQVCMNFNTISVSSGVLNGSLEWTEE